ncbi:MAG TPA: serine/threonine-protein kinase [Drouetiella sp.]
MDEIAAKQLYAKTGITLGEVLGDRYQVTEVLGQGGMGTVFKAINLSLNKPVAVKALHMFLDSFATARFQQEIKAMSMLSHPHLISVLDAGTTSGGTPYFVMEFLDGPALGDLLKVEGALSDVRAIRMFIQMADALAYAHEQGIVHRDLKPNNVVVLTNRGKDFIKLVDLGIAKLVTPEDGAQGLTMTGEIFGSPIYMSPEQCGGKAIDGRSDIYSLGCLMFETVCGEPPIKGGSALETFNLHMTMDAPLLSTMPGVRMTPHLKALESVIARCVQRQPADRFQTMEELSQELERIDRSGAASASYNSASYNPASGSSINPPPPPVRFQLDGASTTLSDPSRKKDVSRDDGSNFEVGSSGKSDSSQAKKNLVVGAGAFFVVFCLSLLASQFITHRNPPPPQTVPAYAQNPQSYVDTAAIQKSIQEATDRQLSQHNTVSYPANSGNSKVEVLAVYMGKGQDVQNANLPGNVEVDVKDSDKPITLVLVSYMPTNWKIMREGPAVKIAKVLVSSYKSPCTVSGVPNGVPVERSWYQFLDEEGRKLDSPRKDNPFECFSLGTALNPGTQDLEDQGDFQNMKKIVEGHLKEPIKSFQGAYREDRFTVQ